MIPKNMITMSQMNHNMDTMHCLSSRSFLLGCTVNMRMANSVTGKRIFSINHTAMCLAKNSTKQVCLTTEEKKKVEVTLQWIYLQCKCQGYMLTMGNQDGTMKIFGDS